MSGFTFHPSKSVRSVGFTFHPSNRHHRSHYFILSFIYFLDRSFLFFGSFVSFIHFFGSFVHFIYLFFCSFVHFIYLFIRTIRVRIRIFIIIVIIIFFFSSAGFIKIIVNFRGGSRTSQGFLV